LLSLEVELDEAEGLDTSEDEGDEGDDEDTACEDSFGCVSSSFCIYSSVCDDTVDDAPLDASELLAINIIGAFLYKAKIDTITAHPSNTVTKVSSPLPFSPRCLFCLFLLI
jgi:hypothetical protein